MRRLFALIIVVLLPGAALAASPSPTPVAAAQPGRGVSMVPAPSSPHRSASGTFLELGIVKLGVPTRDTVRVLSTFDEPRQVLLYAADAQPAVGGGFGFGARTATPTQVGAWLRLPRTQALIPAHGSLDLPVTVVVPQGTSGGEYVGGVMAEAVEQGANSPLQTRTRFAMAVYLKVPGGKLGETPGRGQPNGRLEVVDVHLRFDGSHVCPVVRYRNNSQDIVDPRVDVRSKGLLGSGSHYASPRTGAVLPGSEATVPLRCLSRPIGPGKVAVTLRSPRGGGTESFSASWLPMSLVFALLILLLLIGALITTFVRGLRRREEPAAAIRQEP